MKNAGMAGAVALVGIGLITIGLSNFANRAEAVPSAVANAGPAEPVIVAHHIIYEGYGRVAEYRLWNDGRLERRVIGEPVQGDDCELRSQGSCGWHEIAEPPGGNGFACRSDINGDRNIDAEDLGLLLAGWGQEISCDPQPSYPCFDLDGLNGLNMNIAAR